MTSTVSLIVVICVALFTSVTAPLLIAHRTEKMHKEDREADWARQDRVAKAAADAAQALLEGQREVAAQAAEAARLLQEKQGETAAAAERARTDLAASQKAIADQAARAADLLLANNERVAVTQAETNGKLDVIHTLVNSNMTTAMQSEYDAVVRELAMMREVMALNQAAGRQPTAETIGAIEATETKITELAAALEDRARAALRAAGTTRETRSGETGA